jgi:hypothetical protein
MGSRTAARASGSAILIVLGCWMSAITKGAEPGPSKTGTIPLNIYTDIDADLADTATHADKGQRSPSTAR